MALNIGSASDAARARQGVVGLRWFGQSSFASHVTIRARCVVPVRQSLPLHLLGPMGCSFMTGAGAVFNDLDVQDGQRVAIFGAGAVGLAAVMAARIAGAGEVTVFDQDADRLAIALELGATRTVLAPSEGAIPERELGAYECALDTTSNAAVARAALRNLDPPGQLVLVGGTHLEITPLDLAGRRLTLSMEGSADPGVLVPRLCEYWKLGQFPFERIITKYAFGDVAQALDDASTGRVIKPVLIP